MAQKMRIKFDKYQSTCNLMMSLGMVFDLRYRMTYIDFFGLIHGENSHIHVGKIKASLRTLFSDLRFFFSFDFIPMPFISFFFRSLQGLSIGPWSQTLDLVLKILDWFDCSTCLMQKPNNVGFYSVGKDLLVDNDLALDQSDTSLHVVGACHGI